MDKLLSYNFFMAHRAITKHMNEIFGEEREITITQLFALWAVDENSGHNLTYIAKKLCMDRTTLFRTIDRMADLINLGRVSGHRSLSPKLTKLGKDLLSNYMDISESKDKKLYSFVDSLDSFMSSLRTIVSSIGYGSKTKEEKKK